MTPRALAILVVFVFALGLSPAGAAATSATNVVFVVTVDAAATELDAARLRLAIGKELDATVVPPGDPRASEARGTIAVSIDRSARALVISYREHGAPITRTIDLPADAAATARAAVLLAGNLARDEASELAAALRKSAPAPDVAPVPTPAPKPAPPTFVDADLVDEEEAAVDARDRRDLDSMGRILARYAGYHRTERLTVAWSSMGLGLGAMGTGLYLELQAGSSGASSTRNLALVLNLTALPLLTLGLAALPSGLLDEVKRYYAEDRATGRPTGMIRAEVEAAWWRNAHRERSLRRTSGWILTVLGGAFVALESVAFAVALHEGAPTQSVVELAVNPLGVAMSMDCLLGVMQIVEDGPVESALHAYERASGRAIWKRSAQDLAFGLVPVPGGGALGLGGRF